MYGKHKKPPENVYTQSSIEKMAVLIKKLNSVVANSRCEESAESISCLIDLQKEARVLCEINST